MEQMPFQAWNYPIRVLYDEKKNTHTKRKEIRITGQKESKKKKKQGS